MVAIATLRNDGCRSEICELDAGEKTHFCIYVYIYIYIYIYIYM